MHRLTKSAMYKRLTTITKGAMTSKSAAWMQGRTMKSKVARE